MYAGKDATAEFGDYHSRSPSGTWSTSASGPLVGAPAELAGDAVAGEPA